MGILGQAEASDVPCRILCSGAQARLISGGEFEDGVRRVREKSGANVQLLEGRSLPAAFRARDECFVVIQADGPPQLRAAVAGTLRRGFGIAEGPLDAPPVADDGRQRIVEVMIPEVACRHLVGARGDRIKLLRAEAGCDVQLAPGEVAGVAAQRRVRCSGSLAGVEEAVARVHEVLVEFMMIGILHPRHFDVQEVSCVPGSAPSAASRERGALLPAGAPAGGAAAAGFLGAAGGARTNSRLAVRLLVSKDECGWLIGKRGNKIHKLRELALVSTRDADAELLPPGAPPGAASVVEIFGAPLAKEICVLQLIVDDLALMRDAPSTSRLVVPAEDGRTLTPERLDLARGRCPLATVRLEMQGSTWCVVELGGLERDRLLAAAAVHELLEETPDASPAHPGNRGANGVNGFSSSSRSDSCAGVAAPAREATSASLAPAPALAGRPGGNLSNGVTTSGLHSPAVAAAPAKPLETAGSARPAAESSQAVSLPSAASPCRAAVASSAPAPATASTAWPTPAAMAPPVAAVAQAPAAALMPTGTFGGTPAAPQLTLRLPIVAGTQAAAAALARYLASDASGISRRAGVSLAAECIGGCGWVSLPDASMCHEVFPVLAISGTPVANAVACLLVQRASWLHRAMGSTAGFYC
eukprot:TRINITY_DN14782_c0_g4_i1.p1 TRINITY_DN14782_c0_g4~~TRINITY_DN14782_c0_g4_i1.p1  ORF type:complete len:644 (+),score=143.47 TRINITY_DN14782_c0_g4_i1:118-2049(+)